MGNTGSQNTEPQEMTPVAAGMTEEERKVAAAAAALKLQKEKKAAAKAEQAAKRAAQVAARETAHLDSNRMFTSLKQSNTTTFPSSSQNLKPPLMRHARSKAYKNTARPPTRSRSQTIGGGKKRYIKSPKGRRLVRKGPRGGKYYIYNGRKVYLSKKK